MKIELIFFVSSDFKNELSLNSLSHIVRPFNVDYSEESTEFVIRLALKCEDLIQIVKNQLFDERGSSCIVISDQLIDYNEDSQPIPSDTSLSIFEDIRQSTSLCGFIALTETPTPHVTGIDSNVVMNKEGWDKLRTELEKISTRLWYKKPPNNLYHHNAEHIYSVEISPIADKNTLEKSLELRGRVYSALGYINEKSSIEMDAYDLSAIHFVAVDRANQDRIAGTMRLILTGTTAIHTTPEQYNKINTHKKWCTSIARNHHDRQWWRTIQRRSPIALPVLGAFTYFDIPDQAMEIDETLMPRNICELSRVIVAPEYRGMGISNMLVTEAISVAKKLRRDYLWIECAPHHINMYKKYGFLIKENDGLLFYDRAQRLDTWAVAMYLGVSDEHNLTTDANTVCYRLHVTREQNNNSENCSLLFRFNQHSADHVEQIFDSAINVDQALNSHNSPGVTMPLKKLILTTLSRLDIKHFLVCLETLMQQAKIEKLSMQHSTGRSFSFNPKDLYSNKRKAIESQLQHWFR